MLEIKDGIIYRNGTEVTPERNANGKVVTGTSANGLWFLGCTNGETFKVYKKDLRETTKDAHEIFFKYCE